MNKWYYLVKGKAQGPVTENQIRDLIREHQLTLNDIIFREGDSKWRRISEYSDTNFAQEAVGETNLQQLVRLPTKSDSGKWVVLLKIQTETEIKFVQKGSWTTEEVKSAIQRGEVSYSDHIWKSGFTKWERIGDLDEFSFKGETQIFSLTAPGKLKLSDSDLELKRSSTSTATKAALRHHPVPEDEIEKTEKVDVSEKIDLSEKTEHVVTEDFSEKTRMGFSLKLDKSRLSDLIQKASQEVDEGKTESKPEDQIRVSQPEIEKTVIDTSFDDGKTQIEVAPKFPGAAVTPAKAALVQPSPTALVFDDDEENRKESSLWMATRTGKTKSIEGTSKTKTRARQRRAKKRKFWNTIFQATQITLVLVIVGLGFATFQNIQKKRKKIDAQAIASEASEVVKPKKRKPVNEEAEVAAPAPKTEAAAEVSAEPASEPEVVDAPSLPEAEIVEEVDMASKAPEKSFPPIKPRMSTPFVKIKPMEINGKTPKIRLSSNANEGELIKLSIRAMTGEVLSRPSFRVEKNIPRRRGKEPEINLSALGVTPGYYTVEAEMAGAKSLLEHVFIGTRKNFDNLVREYRKEISYRQQWEKKSLLRISTDVAALTKELFEKYGSTDSVKEWQEFFSDWRARWRETDSNEMRSLSARNQNEYAYPQLWFDMRTVRQKINAESEGLNSAFLSSRRTASSPNRKLLSEASGIVDRVGDLSGWRQKSTK